MKSPPFKKEFLELAADGRERSAEEIREALSMPENRNVTAFLHLLSARLIYDTANIRLKNRSTSHRGKMLLWRLEPHAATNHGKTIDKSDK